MSFLLTTVSRRCRSDSPVECGRRDDAILVLARWLARAPPCQQDDETLLRCFRVETHGGGQVRVRRPHDDTTRAKTIKFGVDSLRETLVGAPEDFRPKQETRGSDDARRKEDHLE